MKAVLDRKFFTYEDINSLPEGSWQKRVVLVDLQTELVILFKHESKVAEYYGFDEEFEFIDEVMLKVRDLL
ncbi:hypothetical protein [Thermodesulfovibrio hydrogeniphilus]